MTALDLSRLGNWAGLPFFEEDLPDITTRLAEETRAIYPPAPQIFAALERVQPDDVRVVILGQDPYPQPGKANGLAFSISADFPPRKRRDSLHNIFDELERDLGHPRHRTDLSDWADQGVLLLNALALSVPHEKAAGHRRLGWQKLTTQVLARLADRPRAYLLWGGDAHRAAEQVSDRENLILKTSHPSPMGVHKTGPGYEAFFGSRPFSRVNAWLQAQDLPAINWGDPEGP